MTDAVRRRLDVRTMVMLLVFDAVSYIALYWLLLPSFDDVLGTLNSATLLGVTHVVSVLRLTVVGALAARSFRARRGLDRRGDMIPSIAVGAAASLVLMLLLGILVRALAGAPQAELLETTIFAAEWIVFPLVGVLFVQPGPPDEVRLRRGGRRSASERGAMSVATVPAVLGLIALAAIVILVVGSATVDRRTSQTAADAAALAAADVWDERLGSLLGSGVGVGLWDLIGLPVLGNGVQDSMRAAAADYAERNDAELIAMSVDVSRREVAVRVRHEDTLPDADHRVEAEATARIELHGGLCSIGGLIGLLLDGGCVRAVPPPVMVTPTPTPDPEDEDTEDKENVEPEPTPTPTPSQAPPAVGRYDSDIVLVG